MAGPLIGISTYLEASARWGVWDQSAALLPAGYHRQVQRTGGVAVLLPPDETPGAARTLVTRLDGLVIAGGPDVEPARYGAHRDPRTGPPAPERDAWETALIEAALDARLPLLGVCRGMQLLNVVLGGTLHQHIEGHAGPPGVFAEHKVTPVPGTLLARALPEPVPVPTYHHQAVDALAPALRASAFAEDGTVEAVERPAADGYALAVQWHPEAAMDPRLMRALITAASA
ncbi:gamma-glutamyl-gamma-aminobutyrate hydrolase family protein [Streptomyces sp. SBT349]|uniref:gamma-glutamyl-gamma-aminobutyrate hydrolase family protein n=1 Tax=Streptomyces sp. SBT349 TaxID=1580539 RepID=UPI00066E2AF3|nr:gamma-glutamyl-gamma-aminobutyrate hydrolase family protein [Streptomyces sp. SBT349]